MTSDSASLVTRSRRRTAAALALVAGAIVEFTALEAQESPGAAQPGPAATAPAAAGTGAAPAASDKPPATAQAPAAPASPQPSSTEAKPPPASGRSGERFEPTEKVRADFDVSFPVDI